MLGYAQTNEDGKESVYIDYFSRPGSISNILAEALRNKIFFMFVFSFIINAMFVF